MQKITEQFLSTFHMVWYGMVLYSAQMTFDQACKNSKGVQCEGLHRLQF